MGGSRCTGAGALGWRRRATGCLRDVGWRGHDGEERRDVGVGVLVMRWHPDGGDGAGGVGWLCGQRRRVCVRVVCICV